ncbi:MAG: YIP1 family protein [Candidatus Rokuibacteriota bacterium]|nr:MAG: YIP1 family protein [Candidatus Rokubacteria bacterium]
MSIVDRAKKIILQPKQEWYVIDREPTSVGELYTSYILPLAAIGPIASIIGWSVVGLSSPMAGTFRSPIGAAVIQAVVHYVLGLVGVFVLALIIDQLAPTFAGRKNRLQALKVAAYSSTTVWLVGIAGLVPALSVLWLLSLYSLYPLYVGLPRLMKVPGEKAMDYTVVVAICAVVLFFIVEIIGTRTPGM